MSRSARVTALGQPHFILARANGGSKLFYEEEDFHSYVNILLDLAKQEVIQLFGFCLHSHELRLLLTPVGFSLSRVMQRIHGSHTLRINHRENRRGPLFQGRFESHLISEEQLLEAIRNIHLWPVRKGWVRRPENYSWSTHSTYLGLDDRWSNVLSSDLIFDSFSESEMVSRRAFARYVEEAALDPEEDLGSYDLSELKKVGRRPKRLSLSALAKRVGLLLNVNLMLLTSGSRRQDLVMARRLFSTAAVINSARSITEVAEFLKRDKAQVSRLVSQGMEMISKNEPFKLLFKSV